MHCETRAVPGRCSSPLRSSYSKPPSVTAAAAAATAAAGAGVSSPGAAAAAPSPVPSPQAPFVPPPNLAALPAAEVMAAVFKARDEAVERIVAALPGTFTRPFTAQPCLSFLFVFDSVCVALVWKRN